MIIALHFRKNFNIIRVYLLENVFLFTFAEGRLHLGNSNKFDYTRLALPLHQTGYAQQSEQVSLRSGYDSKNRGSTVFQP